ncbi:hypothetical protein M9Y10_045870 [Tritrichomonas musculus]|uniref:eIF3a PCI domain-containing protein n=1 Tax=Tritrichomonas musculus TaxID=1915356 RepID=A0ABR2JWG8_9EUKA
MNLSSITDVARQVNFLLNSNQKREAFTVIQHFFNDQIQVQEYTESLNFLFTNAIKLSIQFLVPIPNILQSLLILKSDEMEFVNNQFIAYIQQSRIMIGDKQQYSAKAKDIIRYSIPSNIVDDLLVTPTINFFYEVFVSILECLRNNRKLGKLYFTIIKMGYETATELESQQLHDSISKELDNLCGNLKLKNSIRYRVVDALFLRFRTALELGLYKRAFKALCDVSLLISSHDAPIELHEHLEVQKTILLEIRENRVPAANQLLNLIKFYQTTPMPPSLPLQSLTDLALMTALAGDLKAQTDTSYEKLLGSKALSRDEMIAELLERVKRVSLKRYVIIAEEHKNPTEICIAFKDFLTEYGKEFHVPLLFKSLGVYTTYRIIQAALQDRNEVPLAELENAIKWMNPPEIHQAIINGNKIGLFNCKINMIKNCIVSKSK